MQIKNPRMPCGLRGFFADILRIFSRAGLHCGNEEVFCLGTGRSYFGRVPLVSAAELSMDSKTQVSVSGV